jgi:hypothetical protein
MHLQVEVRRSVLSRIDINLVRRATRHLPDCCIFWLEGISQAEIGLDKIFHSGIEVVISSADPIVVGLTKESNMGSKSILDSAADVPESARSPPLHGRGPERFRNPRRSVATQPIVVLYRRGWLRPVVSRLPPPTLADQARWSLC